MCAYSHITLQNTFSDIILRNFTAVSIEYVGIAACCRFNLSHASAIIVATTRA